MVQNLTRAIPACIGNPALSQCGVISQEKAASIAGLDRTDFLLALAREQAEAFVVDFADLERKPSRG